ncbi:hypothetical protein GOARA_091_00240 [Gordonia araii NBRC 100433]|uniref:ESAT-6-like protein n=1 Tax=Gordonia araii NBRC 100433 TaxID=1073574 RepID=G7H7T1_9ACTN|nr:WXG100 family type VII secretion target [Gordonia araii]NNG95653.1 WXG100 family type VII secretion target [Gordonia araii NBRC 100433]GAB11906.1 hypothetical protein GOARA_091_00240 [Gordonia araii NBRC 100433]
MMKYDFNDIWRLADALRANGKALVDQTEVLESAVSELRGTFTGGAAAAYDDAMNKWKTELSDTQDILNKIANQVEEGARQMKITDDTNAASLA